MSVTSTSSRKLTVENEPFRHVVTQWVQPEIVRAADVAFPDLQWSHWHRYSTVDAMKYASKDSLRLPPACSLAIEDMSRFPIGDVFGVSDCFPDLELHAAGMHCIPQGGYLGEHVDAQRHPIHPWARRFSAVLFLNSGEGGRLKMGDKTVRWEAGSMVVFECSDCSRHEVETVPVKGPARKTLSLFWWSVSESTSESARSVFSREQNLDPP